MTVITGRRQPKPSHSTGGPGSSICHPMQSFALAAQHLSTTATLARAPQTAVHPDSQPLYLSALNSTNVAATTPAFPATCTGTIPTTILGETSSSPARSTEMQASHPRGTPYVDCLILFREPLQPAVVRFQAHLFRVQEQPHLSNMQHKHAHRCRTTSPVIYPQPNATKG